MRTRHSIGLFDHEGQIIVFGVFSCLAFAVFRTFRCDILLNHQGISDRVSAIMLMEGYIFEDLGLGFFDNAIFGINFYIPIILIMALLDNRYESEKAYFFCRFGIMKYFFSNIMLSAFLMLGTEIIQLIVYGGYSILLIPLDSARSDLTNFILYMVLHYLCWFIHSLITWLISIFINGFLKYLLPVILIFAEISASVFFSGRKLFWCPISAISFVNAELGHNLFFIIWLFIICLAAGSMIANTKRSKDIL